MVKSTIFTDKHCTLAENCRVLNSFVLYNIYCPTSFALMMADNAVQEPLVHYTNIVLHSVGSITLRAWSILRIFKDFQHLNFLSQNLYIKCIQCFFGFRNLIFSPNSAQFWSYSAIFYLAQSFGDFKQVFFSSIFN